MGADEVLDVTGRAATDAVLDLTRGEGADLVIEAVGSVPTLNQALNIVREQGHVCAFGLPESSEPVPFEWDTFFRRRVTMNAVFGAQDEPGLPDFQAALDMNRRRGDRRSSTHNAPFSHWSECRKPWTLPTPQRMGRSRLD